MNCKVVTLVSTTKIALSLSHTILIQSKLSKELKIFYLPSVLMSLSKDSVF